MNKQINLSFFSDELKEVKTHKKEFLEQIERIMPWGELEELVRPCYYEGKRGNKPYDLAPLPELMDRKKRDIMERKGDKEDENKRQKQQKESSAAAL